MKKFLSSFLLFLALAAATLGLNNIVFATGETGQRGTPQPAKQLDDIMEQSGLEGFASRYHRLSSTQPGADIITSLIFTTIDFIKYLLGGVAVLYVIISGVKLVTAGKKIDEVSEKEKENLKYIIYGLVLVITADELVTKVFFGDYGECLASSENMRECARTGSSLIKGIYSLILSVMASVAVLVLVIAAFRLVTAYGNEETIKKEGNRIKMAIVGLLVSATGEFVVKRLIFRSGGTRQIDILETQRLVYRFVNFVAGFIGAAAFIMLFYGGYLYVASFGNDEKTGKAKKIIISAIIGIVIAFAAFGIVMTVTSITNFRLGGQQMPQPNTLPPR